MRQLYYGMGLLGAALLAGCHHDAEPTGYDLTGKYTATTTLTAANPAAMYTVAGQVTDPTVLSRFIKRRTWLATYFSSTDVPITGGYDMTLTFRANHRATIKTASASYVDSIRTEVTDQQPTSFHLQNLDSTNSYLSSVSNACFRTTELSGYIRGVNAGTHCSPVATSSGYGQACRARPVRVIGARGSQLYVPYFSWYIQGGGCYLAYGGEWNTFNRAVLSHLVAGDTIVVQEREIALRR